MRFSAFLALAAVGGASAIATAQQSVYSYSTSSNSNRAALGVTTSTSGTLRDTLGILITSLTKGGPAEKAGLEEGNRIASINGVSLRANAADVEDSDMSNALTRRLTRELGKLKAGDEVELRVYRDGKISPMKIKTADAEELFRPATTIRRATVEDRENRPMLGFSLGSTGSRRDTLGVLVMGVTDSTPAAKAGIEEGNRIAAINGVNLRLSRDEAGDREMSSIKASRLQREIANLKVGDNVTLSVYSNGRFRDVTMKVGRAGDLPKSARGGFTIMGGDGFSNFSMPMMPAMPRMAPMPPSASYRLNMEPSIRYDMTPEVRARINDARVHVERALEGARVELRQSEPAMRRSLEEARVQLHRTEPLLRRSLEDARVQIERAQPLIRQNLNEARIRLETTRPQLNNLRDQLERVRVAPRVRITTVTV